MFFSHKKTVIDGNVVEVEFICSTFRNTINNPFSRSLGIELEDNLETQIADTHKFATCLQ